MNVLIIGSGAREHALAWKLRQSPRVTDLFVAPGNAGTAALAGNLPLEVPKTGAPPPQVHTFLDEAAALARHTRAELVVVGPEDPLIWGLADLLRVHGFAAFGPSRQAAEIEGSKGFAKALMTRHQVPTAAGRSFDSYPQALAYLRQAGVPVVVKADGPAAGKGVTVADTLAEAEKALQAAMVDRAFGEAGARVVIEERLTGRELSVQAFTDGEAVALMPFARDHKAVLDGDRGPNTGGMGAYAPVPDVGADLGDRIRREVAEPLVQAMGQEGRPYQGVLYPGLMLTRDGPKVLEVNCRFGDPETQVVLPLLESDLLEVLLAVAERRLAGVEVRWSGRACVGVVLASGGYPGPYRTGFPISGLEDLEPDALVFHAGTRQEEGAVVTAGGRVLTVVATGATLAEARERAYDNLRRLRFQGMHYRTDIASGAEG